MSSAVLPLSPEVLLSELISVQSVVDKWVQRVSEGGVPGVTRPIEGNTPPEERLDQWLMELIGELRLVSGKADNMAQILTSVLME